MIITDNKKPLNLGGLGVLNVITKEVNNMSSLALSFNEVNFTPVQKNGQVWLKTSELAEALGYSDQSGVTRIYSRNEDEFTQAMSCSVKLTEKGQSREIRVFSLRGCHLIAMFSKTAIAKQFRKWVLDILDREVFGKQIESRQSVSPEQQALLHEIVARRSNGERKIFAEMWSRHNRHFKIARYSQLLAIHFPEAIHYLETMDIKAKAEKQEVKTNKIEVDKHYHDNVYGLALHMIWVNRWWREFGDAIRVISPRMAGAINDHFSDGVCFAYHFVDKPTRLEIDERVKYFSWHLTHTERMVLDYKRK